MIFLFSVVSESEHDPFNVSQVFFFPLQGQTCVFSFSCSVQEQTCQCTERAPDRATGLPRRQGTPHRRGGGWGWGGGRENWAWVDRDNWRCQGTLLCNEILEGEKKIPFETELNQTTKSAVTDLQQGLPKLE